MLEISLPRSLFYDLIIWEWEDCSAREGVVNLDGLKKIFSFPLTLEEGLVDFKVINTGFAVFCFHSN